jgi:putative NADPH-quinone reductase
MIEDMEKFKKKMLDPFQDKAAYNKIPIQVKRWKKAGRKKTGSSGAQKKIIAFCASPRRNGNTDLLVEEALKGARDAGAKIEKVMLQKIKMDHCIGCRKCKEPDYDDICVIKDEMAGIYQKIINADALIIGFPIYTGRECAQLCTFLDRWDGYERYMLKSCLEPGRVAMVIGTWGYPYINTYDHVIESVISTLNLHKVETIEAISACGFEGILHGLDEKRRGVILRHPKQLKKAYAAGRALVA